MVGSCGRLGLRWRNNNWAHTAQTGHRAGAKAVLLPGQRPQAHLWARDVPRPVGSALLTGSKSRTSEGE